MLVPNHQTRFIKLNAFQFCITLIVTVVLCAEDYQEESVVQHNKYRKRFQAPPLSMSEELNEAAVKCAGYYSETRKLAHDCPYLKVKNFTGELGENLYAFMGAKFGFSRLGGGAGYSWWNEHKKYNPENPKFSHFTQQIWKATTHMGIGCKYNDKVEGYCVALYYPPGNVIGYMKKNLAPRDESVTE